MSKYVEVILLTCGTIMAVCAASAVGILLSQAIYAIVSVVDTP